MLNYYSDLTCRSRQLAEFHISRDSRRDSQGKTERAQLSLFRKEQTPQCSWELLRVKIFIFTVRVICLLWQLNHVLNWSEI